MSADAEQKQGCIDSHAAADNADAQNARQLSLNERGVLLMSACRSAAEIYRSRLAAGLPVELPAPWPESTWQFLKAQARNVRQQPHS